MPPFGKSVFEGVADGAVEVCLNVTGRFSGGRNLSVTVVGRPNQSMYIGNIISVYSHTHPV